MLLIKAIVVITIGITLASGRKIVRLSKPRTVTGKFHFMSFSSLCQVKKDRFCILFFCHSHSALCNVYLVALDRTRRQTLLISLWLWLWLWLWQKNKVQCPSFNESEKNGCHALKNLRCFCQPETNRIDFTGCASNHSAD